MNFSLYNILSQLVPGFIVYAAVAYTFDIDYKGLDPLVLTAIAYSIGFVINSISAWIEGSFFRILGGLPSDELLKGKSCGRIKFYEWDKCKTLLKERNGGADPKTSALFGTAMRVANNEGRIQEMSNEYAFARGMLIAFVGAGLILALDMHCEVWFWLTYILLVLITAYRTKEKGYYYAKEVLTTALNKLEA